MSSLSTLPNELQYQLLLELPLESLYKMCQVNSLYRDICNDNLFWKAKVFNDFGYRDEPSSGWKSLYIKLLTDRKIPVCVYLYPSIIRSLNDCHIIGEIVLSLDDTLDTTYEKIRQLYLDIYHHRMEFDYSIIMYNQRGQVLGPLGKGLPHKATPKNLAFISIALDRRTYRNLRLPEASHIGYARAYELDNIGWPVVEDEQEHYERMLYMEKRHQKLSAINNRVRDKKKMIASMLAKRQ